MNKQNKSCSIERQQYILKTKVHKFTVISIQLSILLIFILLWEVTARLGIINPFIISSPSRIFNTFFNLSSNGLLIHIYTTLYETIVGFVVGIVLGIVLATILWWSALLTEIFEPYLVVINSLPKIALGPIIIIWMGAGTKAIIFMAIAISLVVTVMELLNGFHLTDPGKIKMARTFSASRRQIFFKIVFPSNLQTLFNSMKVNLGLSLVGVIAGEFLVSKAGLGYLIVYGGQVFKLDLVMTSVIILAIVAELLYTIISILEKIITRAVNHTV